MDLMVIRVPTEKASGVAEVTPPELHSLKRKQCGKYPDSGTARLPEASLRGGGITYSTSVWDMTSAQ